MNNKIMAGLILNGLMLVTNVVAKEAPKPIPGEKQTREMMALVLGGQSGLMQHMKEFHICNNKAGINKNKKEKCKLNLKIALKDSMKKNQTDIRDTLNKQLTKSKSK